MKKTSLYYIDHLIERYPKLNEIKINIIQAVDTLSNTIAKGGKLLICGNGGSAADSDHIVGELMKGFILKRKLDYSLESSLYNEFPESADYLISNLQLAIPAISLTNHTALTSAFSNDRASDLIFAQQVLGYGNDIDTLLAISTSGNSKNIIYASQIAHVKGLKVISLTGQTGGQLKKYSDVLLNVPELETYKVQELHLPIYHAICLALESEFFGE